MGPGQAYVFSLSLEMYRLHFFRRFSEMFFKPRNVPATFFSAMCLDVHFFQGPEKEPERPYDQNDGSFAPRSLI